MEQHKSLCNHQARPSVSKIVEDNSEPSCKYLTMLKYHLARLCESGELVLTSGQRYLLAAAANSNKKIRTKSRRKSGKRKKGWDWEIMRSKRRRKVTRKTNMLHKGDNVEVLKDNNNEMLCNEQKYQRTSKEVHEQEVCMLDGNKQLKSDEVELLSSQQKCCGASKSVNEAGDCVMGERQRSEVEVRTGLVNLSFAEDNGANCGSDVRSSSTPSLPRDNNLLKFGMQHRANEPIVGPIYSVSPNAQLDLSSKQVEDNYIKHSTLERPPRFETVTSEGSSQFQPQIAETEIIDIEKSHHTMQKLLERLSGDRACGKGQTSIEHLSMEHQRQKKVAQRNQGNQTSMVLRSQVPKQELSKVGTNVKFLASQNPEHRVHQEMLPKAKPNALGIHQAKQGLALKGPKSKPSTDAMGDIKKRLGFRGRGRPPKARLLVEDIAPLTDEDQQSHAVENLDSTLVEMLDLKSVDNLQLEQQLGKPRCGRPPKPEGEASTVVKFNLKYKTTYRGRGRPRLTDRF